MLTRGKLWGAPAGELSSYRAPFHVPRHTGRIKWVAVTGGVESLKAVLCCDEVCHGHVCCVLSCLSLCIVKCCVLWLCWVMSCCVCACGIVCCLPLCLSWQVVN